VAPGEPVVFWNIQPVVFWDILLAVVLAGFTFRLAYLGVYVSIHPPESDKQKKRFKREFWGLAILAVVLIGVQTVRNSTTYKENSITQKESSARLEGRKRNTQEQEEVTKRKLGLSKRLNKLAGGLKKWDSEKRTAWNKKASGVRFLELSDEQREAARRKYENDRASNFDKKFSQPILRVLQEANELGLDTNQTEEVVRNDPTGLHGRHGDSVQSIYSRLSGLAEKLKS
jgi:hypothetical protein